MSYETNEEYPKEGKKMSTYPEEFKALEEENKRLREFVKFTDRMVNIGAPAKTYKAWQENVAKLAAELEESLQDDPEWEKVDGKWRPCYVKN